MHQQLVNWTYVTNKSSNLTIIFMIFWLIFWSQCLKTERKSSQWNKRHVSLIKGWNCLWILTHFLWVINWLRILQWHVCVFVVDKQFVNISDVFSEHNERCDRSQDINVSLLIGNNCTVASFALNFFSFISFFVTFLHRRHQQHKFHIKSISICFFFFFFWCFFPTETQGWNVTAFSAAFSVNVCRWGNIMTLGWHRNNIMFVFHFVLKVLLFKINVSDWASPELLIIPALLQRNV